VTDVVFHPLAEQELVEAANFYDERAAGLGNDFIREVEHMLAQIIATPKLGPFLRGQSGDGSSDGSHLRFCIKQEPKTFP
jgi:hypothetical protein